jgi:hypothetical protein
MTAEALFVYLHQQGVIFKTSDHGIRYLLPSSRLRSTLREMLRHNRDELRALFALDDTLPKKIVIPKACPNEVKAIKAAIDSQRIVRRFE